MGLGFSLAYGISALEVPGDPFWGECSHFSKFPKSWFSGINRPARVRLQGEGGGGTVGTAACAEPRVYQPACRLTESMCLWPQPPGGQGQRPSLSCYWGQLQPAAFCGVHQPRCMDRTHASTCTSVLCLQTLCSTWCHTVLLHGDSDSFRLRTTVHAPGPWPFWKVAWRHAVGRAFSCLLRDPYSQGHQQKGSLEAA